MKPVLKIYFNFVRIHIIIKYLFKILYRHKMFEYGSKRIWMNIYKVKLNESLPSQKKCRSLLWWEKSVRFESVSIHDTDPNPNHNPNPYPYHVRIQILISLIFLISKRLQHFLQQWFIKCYLVKYSFRSFWIRIQTFLTDTDPITDTDPYW